MAWTIWPALAGAAAWVGWALLVHRLLGSPRRDLWDGLLHMLGGGYMRFMQRLVVEGVENIPTGRDVGPLIVASNHTAGIDPALIEINLPFPIRWVMAADMRLPLLEAFWRWRGIIFVARELPADAPVAGRSDAREISSAGIREAIRHVKGGGVLGIFPEGGIERAPRQIMPFLRGMGIIVTRTNAPVLPVVIEGTPAVDPAWASIWRRPLDRARVRFLPVVSYAGSGLGPAEIMDDLRRRFVEATGWPANDDPRWSLLDGEGDPKGPWY